MCVSRDLTAQVAVLSTSKIFQILLHKLSKVDLHNCYIYADTYEAITIILHIMEVLALRKNYFSNYAIFMTRGCGLLWFDYASFGGKC